jgi:hypothetical protein
MRYGYALPMVLFAATLQSCSLDIELGCTRAAECADDEFCRAGRCVPALGVVPLSPSEAVRTSSTRTFEHDAGLDGFLDGDHVVFDRLECEGGEMPTSSTLVLNEILVNVPSGLQGDANGDGIRHAHDDEFLELVNIGERPLIMTGVSIANDRSVRFVFPPYCLHPLTAAVVFGGIEPGATPPSGPGFEAFVSERRFAYANDGGTARILDATDREILRLDYGRSPAQSLALFPELYGQRYITHGELADGRLMSPGTCADGHSIRTGCPDLREVADAGDAGVDPGGSDASADAQNP